MAGRAVTLAGRPGGSPLRVDDRGAAVVEFALALPFFMMLLLGTVSTGLVLHHRLLLNAASREGARYAAVVAADECDPTSDCGGLSWAALIRDRTVVESAGSVEPADVCVALVAGSGAAPTPLSSAHTTEVDGSACFADSVSDSSYRVQVEVRRTDHLEWFLGSSDIMLRARATMKYEQ